MKILSINTSEPQKVIFNGKELITSIYKKPVSKKVQVTPQGIEGDRQADLSVHGGFDKAVYGYSYTHYKLWGERLEKDFKEFGLVGENLTIDEFDETTINIGDRFQINDCILQVSQPRIPCYKIGIKMNSRDFPKMFSQSGLLGSYSRVIQQGSIETGDQIEKIHSELELIFSTEPFSLIGVYFALMFLMNLIESNSLFTINSNDLLILSIFAFL